MLDLAPECNQVEKFQSRKLGTKAISKSAVFGIHTIPQSVILRFNLMPFRNRHCFVRVRLCSHDVGTKNCRLISCPFCIVYKIPVNFIRCGDNKALLHISGLVCVHRHFIGLG